MLVPSAPAEENFLQVALTVEFFREDFKLQTMWWWWVLVTNSLAVGHSAMSPLQTQPAPVFINLTTETDNDNRKYILTESPKCISFKTQWQMSVNGLQRVAATHIGSADIIRCIDLITASVLKPVFETLGSNHLCR
jgi:hypothetical protein